MTKDKPSCTKRHYLITFSVQSLIAELQVKMLRASDERTDNDKIEMDTNRLKTNKRLQNKKNKKFNLEIE